MTELRVLLYSKSKKQRILFSDNDSVMTTEIEQTFMSHCDVLSLRHTGARINVSDKTIDALQVLQAKYDQATGFHIRKLLGFVRNLFCVVMLYLIIVNRYIMLSNISTFAGNQESMLLKDFFSRFTNEADCVSYFKSIRQSVGIICPKCGGSIHKWIGARRVFQCVNCGNWTSLTQGTVMEKSHLPIYSWLFTAHMMTSFKQVLSAKEVQHQLEMKYYPPAWLMMMKYRDIMGQRDSLYKMEGQIELDISYFPTSFITSKDGEKIKKNKKTGVLVMAESKPIDEIMAEYLANSADEEKMNKASSLLSKSSRMKIKKTIRYIKMYALPDTRFETIKPFVMAMVKDDTKVLTDGGHNLFRLKEVVVEHEAHLETEADVHEVVTKILPWVHIVTGECRSGIEAIHKDIDERFLQLYLNEYCWKFNRRFFRGSKEDRYDLFERLIRIAAKYTSNIKWRDYGNAINDY